VYTLAGVLRCLTFPAAQCCSRGLGRTLGGRREVVAHFVAAENVFHKQRKEG
jgi:hypothetical protein